jgi:hypothetical protein
VVLHCYLGGSKSWADGIYHWRLATEYLASDSARRGGHHERARVL